jgi:TRAP-type C4-dicarboxylate transport system permease small subunit
MSRMREESDRLSQVCELLGRQFSWISCAALLAIVLITFVDVFFRMLGFPITGRSEMVGFLLVAAVCLSFARTETLGMNTSMEFVLKRLPTRSRAVCDSVVNLLSMGVFVVLARQCFVYAKRLLSSGEVTPTLKAPFYPLVYLIALGSLLLALVLLAQLVGAVKKVMEK